MLCVDDLCCYSLLKKKRKCNKTVSEEMQQAKATLSVTIASLTVCDLEHPAQSHDVRRGTVPRTREARPPLLYGEVRLTSHGRPRSSPQLLAWSQDLDNKLNV